MLIFANIFNIFYLMADLKAFRKDNKLTQKEAAAYFECTQGFISQIERGERPIPDVFFERIIADNSINKQNMRQPESNPKENKTNKMIPLELLEMMNKERERFDRQRDRMLDQLDEMLAQQKTLIDTISSQAELLKKGNVHQEDNVGCADASGSDLVR